MCEVMVLCGWREGPFGGFHVRWLMRQWECDVAPMMCVRMYEVCVCDACEVMCVRCVRCVRCVVRCVWWKVRASCGEMCAL